MEATALLELIANPDKYKQMLAELDARKAALDAAIATVGTIDEINDLKAKAEKQLKKANDEAIKVLEDASKKADSLVSTAQKAAEEALAQKASVQAREAQAAALAREAKFQLEDLAAKHKELDKKLAKVSEYEKSLSDKELELNDRLAKLRSVMV